MSCRSATRIPHSAIPVGRSSFFNSEIQNPQSAILLIGPTGSGKTPLGDFLEKNGLFGHRCVHFDFGRNLRKIADSRIRPGFLGVSDFAVVKRVLKTGALLAEQDSHIAGNILTDIIWKMRMGKSDILVLNGLPRHERQAEDIAAIVDVRLVVNLKCVANVVMSRITLNSGGDRVGRVDDFPLFVKKKLEIFRCKTIPLLDHYRRKKVKVVDIEIAEDTTPAETVKYLTSRAGIQERMPTVRKEGKGVLNR